MCRASRLAGWRAKEEMIWYYIYIEKSKPNWEKRYKLRPSFLKKTTRCGKMSLRYGILTLEIRNGAGKRGKWARETWQMSNFFTLKKKDRKIILFNWFCYILVVCSVIWYKIQPHWRMILITLYCKTDS